MDCVFEFFVLVPSGARGKRRDINLALSVAMVCLVLISGSCSDQHLFQDAATRIASARPYTPTVHALILPSQLPLDLRVQFRDLEEAFLVSRITFIERHWLINHFHRARKFQTT